MPATLPESGSRVTIRRDSILRIEAVTSCAQPLGWLGADVFARLKGFGLSGTYHEYKSFDRVSAGGTLT